MRSRPLAAGWPSWRGCGGGPTEPPPLGARGGAERTGAHRVWSLLAAVVVQRTRSGAPHRTPEERPPSALTAEPALLSAMLPVFEAELLERLRPLAEFSLPTATPVAEEAYEV